MNKGRKCYFNLLCYTNFVREISFVDTITIKRKCICVSYIIFIVENSIQMLSVYVQHKNVGNKK